MINAGLIRTAIDYFGKVIETAILIRVIMSWIRISDRNPVYGIVFAVTEPILSPIRRAIFKSPLGGSGLQLDFSPIIAFFLLDAVIGVAKSLIG
jgi:YggT family protein